MDTYYLISNNLEHTAWVIFLTFGRFFGMMQICPIFDKTKFTNFLKATLALLFAIIIFPYFSQVTIGDNLYANLTLFIKELTVGYFLSFLVGMPFWIIESVGNLIDVQRGEQFGATINPTTQNMDSTIGKLMAQSFITYFVQVNGLIFIIDILFKSFQVIKLDQFYPHIMHNPDIYIGLLRDYFYWGVVLTTPLMALMFFMDLTFGLLNSFLPKLNVTVLNMPLKSAVALFILNFYINSLFHNIFVNFVTKLRFFYG